jgi:hypothetical protein
MDFISGLSALTHGWGLMSCCALRVHWRFGETVVKAWSGPCGCRLATIRSFVVIGLAVSDSFFKSIHFDQIIAQTQEQPLDSRRYRNTATTHAASAAVSI